MSRPPTGSNPNPFPPQPVRPHPLYTQTQTQTQLPSYPMAPLQYASPPPPPPPPPPLFTTYQAQSLPYAYPMTGSRPWPPYSTHASFQPPPPPPPRRDAFYPGAGNGGPPTFANGPSSSSPPPPQNVPYPCPSRVHDNHNQNPNHNNHGGSGASRFVCPSCPSSPSFPTALALQKHVATHVTCTYPSCSFSASPKYVNAHYAKAHGKFASSTVHGPRSEPKGLRLVKVHVAGCRPQSFRICVSDHPDDIRQWIEERRQNFPTAARRRGTGNTETTTKPIHTNKKEANDNDNDNDNDNRNHPKNSNDDDNNNNNNNNNNTLSTLLNGYDSSSSDEGDPESLNTPTETTLTNTKNEPFTTNEEEKNPLTLPSSKEGVDSHQSEEGVAVTTNNTTSSATGVCRYYARTGRCRYGSNCRYRHEKTGCRPTEGHVPKKPKLFDKDEQNQRKHPLLSRVSLLEKLLQGEQQRELSLTVQCLHFLAEEGFFQPQPPSS